MFQINSHDMKRIAQIFYDHYGFPYTEKVFIHEDVEYLACGLQVPRGFISFPLLDFGVIKKLSKLDPVDLPRICKGDVVKLHASDESPVGQTLRSASSKATFVLDTDRSYEEFLTSLKSKVRSQLNNIKQKYQFELVVKDQSNLERFYQLYLLKIRDLASIPFKKSFFRDILRLRNSNLIMVTDEAGLVVASSIIIILNNTAHIVWAVSINAHNSNLFMYREIIRFYCDDENIKQFNFGRATIKSSQYNFKKKFGAQEVSLYVYGNCDQFTPSRGHFFSFGVQSLKMIYRRLPLIVIEKLGSILLRFFIR